ncbi:39S ribosomal protein L13, mitochondrial isoform X2 [Bubalus bubalis]|uniref:39S ribosomal protein L13, mitochondrial isoform X2 n=1 Tax=Bubalus bubalis TaxID=89462 RepID=UPI001E1B9D1E|nr:39S ribosomal protein L13, mitochondrial isoform X2 [Bubalus bubalis]
MRQSLQWATFARVWYLLDGKMQPPGKLAALASVRLQGLHKPVYHQLSDCGDHVVIMNTRHIAFSGNKWEQKVYSSHTGYPGGFKQVTAAQLHRKDPVAIVKLAIYGMLPKNLHRRTLMQRLHLFPDEKEELFLREERHLNRVENHTELETPPASVCRVPIGLDAVEQGIHRASEHATENYLKREKSLLR